MHRNGDLPGSTMQSTRHEQWSLGNIYCNICIIYYLKRLGNDHRNDFRGFSCLRHHQSLSDYIICHRIALAWIMDISMPCTFDTIYNGETHCWEVFRFIGFWRSLILFIVNFTSGCCCVRFCMSLAQASQKSKVSWSSSKKIKYYSFYNFIYPNKTTLG